MKFWHVSFDGYYHSEIIWVYQKWCHLCFSSGTYWVLGWLLPWGCSYLNYLDSYTSSVFVRDCRSLISRVRISSRLETTAFVLRMFWAVSLNVPFLLVFDPSSTSISPVRNFSCYVLGGRSTLFFPRLLLSIVCSAWGEPGVNAFCAAWGWARDMFFLSSSWAFFQEFRWCLIRSRSLTSPEMFRWVMVAAI